MHENLRAQYWVFKEGDSLFTGYYGGPAESIGANVVLAHGKRRGWKNGEIYARIHHRCSRVSPGVNDHLVRTGGV